MSLLRSLVHGLAGFYKHAAPTELRSLGVFGQRGQTGEFEDVGIADEVGDGLPRFLTAVLFVERPVRS